MDIETFINIFTLAVTLAGLLISLFKYIDSPKRGWLYIIFFFLADILSEYYWTAYTLIIKEDPDVSALLAYFGWNIAYLILAYASVKLKPADCRRFFHPLILLPIPVNAIQFFIYIRYGGLFNNLWQCTLSTVIACVCMQVILHYIKEKKNGAHFPYFHTAALFYIFTQYGSWTSSCFDFESPATDPYYYFSFATYVITLFFCSAINKDYIAEGHTSPGKDPSSKKSNFSLKLIVSLLIIGCCTAGFYLAGWMKNTVPEGGATNDTYSFIASVLFMISVFLAIIILAITYVIASRNRNINDISNDQGKRSRFNLMFTILITLVLMVISVLYNTIIYYRASVSAIYDSFEEQSSIAATDLENYLTKAISTQKVTADTIELMLHKGRSQEDILQYILDQTKMQAKHLDENFTGLYGYIRGEYMDGLGWVPPDDYVATERGWYKAAVEGNGNTVIVSPYVDAQTQSVVITIAKMLPDMENDVSYDSHNVAALDVIVNHIQNTTENISIGGKGNAMIVNYDGFIVAHKDREKLGVNVRDIYGSELMDRIIETEYGNIKTDVSGEPSSLFINRVMDQWYIVVMVGNDELFKDVYSQLGFNIIVSLVIFSLITFFYYISYINEQASSKKIEEMSVSKQKQEYEAEVLRLEKLSADEANKAKSKFLADMSHEIRTPINAILGMNEMILREADNKNLQEYARNIEISGKNLLQLINSILDFSKIEDGKMEILPVDYSVRSLITYLINSIQERAESKGLTLNIDIDHDIPSELYGDDTRINQIILNLLTNAVKYTPEGSVTLKMQLRKKDKDKALIYVEVKDTGIGIRESDMERLFESFERLDEIRNRNIEGTGLGISITTSLLKLMNSELKVESTYGEGSVFSFELWQVIRSDDPIGDYKAPSVKEHEAYQESFHAPSAHILIVDDTRMNLTVVANLLKKTDIRIDTASGGEEAIKLCDENTYDLILMDQRMPGMNGTQALEQIRALKSAKNIDNPVICLTADAIRGARERYIAEGFTDYLTKPVDGKSLERAMLNYLPKDKIETDLSSAADTSTAETANESTDAKTYDDPLFAALKAIDVNIDTGLSFSGNSAEVYKSILAEYASEYDSRSKSIKDHYSKKDWENYSIFVHSLKSTSKTIGAMKLSEAAAELEAASADKKEAVINAGHEDAMKMYSEIVSVIRNNMDIPDEEDDDDDILEFAPSGDDNT